MVTGDDADRQYIAYLGKGHTARTGAAGKLHIRGALGGDTPDSSTFARLRRWGWSGLSPRQAHQIPDLKYRDRAPTSAKLQFHWRYPCISYIRIISFFGLQNVIAGNLTLKCQESE